MSINFELGWWLVPWTITWFAFWRAASYGRKNCRRGGDYDFHIDFIVVFGMALLVSMLVWLVYFICLAIRS